MVTFINEGSTIANVGAGGQRVHQQDATADTEPLRTMEVKETVQVAENGKPFLGVSRALPNWYNLNEWWRRLSGTVRQCTGFGSNATVNDATITNNGGSG